jgi:hypothetical protein
MSQKMLLAVKHAVMGTKLLYSACPLHLTLLDLITLLLCRKSTNCEAPHYTKMNGIA